MHCMGLQECESTRHSTNAGLGRCVAMQLLKTGTPTIPQPTIRTPRPPPAAPPRLLLCWLH
jgi:hypothetical protein